LLCAIVASVPYNLHVLVAVPQAQQVKVLSLPTPFLTQQEPDRPQPVREKGEPPQPRPPEPRPTPERPGGRRRRAAEVGEGSWNSQG
jgi:hypothetical protein